MRLVVNPRLQLVAPAESGGKHLLFAPVRGDLLRVTPIPDELVPILQMHASVGHVAAAPPRFVPWRGKAEYFELLGVAIRRTQVARPVVYLSPIRRLRTAYAPKAEKPPGGLAFNPDLEIGKSFFVPSALKDAAIPGSLFAPDGPVAWVRDARTALWFPLQLDGETYEFVRRYRARRMPPPSLDPRQAKLLTRAGVLVTDCRETAAADEETGLALRTAGFAKIRAFLPPPVQLGLSLYVIARIREGWVSCGDAQVPGRFSEVNDPVVAFFHRQLQSFVSQQAGVDLVPSYAFLSSYKPGAELKPHVDRDPCDYTFSLRLGVPRPGSAETPAWPLFLRSKTFAIRKAAIVQEIGDAVAFRGTQITHWRTSLPGTELYHSLLFHFVKKGSAEDPATKPARAESRAPAY